MNFMSDIKLQAKQVIFNRTIQKDNYTLLVYNNYIVKQSVY